MSSVTLKKDYAERIVPALVKEFNYSSVMQVPRLTKIVINQGLGIATADKKVIETAVAELTAITGQKAVPTLSKKDISNFKEKLSGSNVSGYGSDKGKNFGDEGEKFRRRRREEAPAEAPEAAGAEHTSQKSEAGEEEVPAAEKTPEGPFFESKKFTPRAVEVPLTDKRPKFSNDKSPRDDGVVSYSSKMDCPSLSLFSRIKNAIASIFGKKPDHGKKKFHKDRRNGDFKGRRHGGEKRPYNKDRRNGDFKRRHDSDRRQGGRHNRDNRGSREG